MKKLYLVLLSALALTFGSCKQETLPQIDVVADQTLLLAPNVGATASFEFTVNAPWTINASVSKVEPDWFIIDKVSGGAGTHTVSVAITKANPKNESRTAYVHLVAGSATRVVAITQMPAVEGGRVVLAKREVALAKGATEQLQAATMPANATTPLFTWTSSNPEVVAVSEKGLLTGVARGAVTIWVELAGGSRDSCSVVVLDGIAVPDANFRKALVKQGFVEEGDDISPTNPQNQKLLFSTTSIDVRGKQTASLVGIEYFPALTQLMCSENQLTVLDLSKNVALTALDCYKNQLAALDLSKHVALTALACHINQLTTLDLSKNVALTHVYCGTNKLAALDLSKNVALTHVYCGTNKLTALDLSKNVALADLECQGNQLAVLDLSNNVALAGLDCSTNQLAALDLSKNVALTHLGCSDNKLTALDLSKNVALIQLSCSNNGLTVLDISKNPMLQYLTCNANKLTALNVASLGALDFDIFLCGLQNPDATLILTLTAAQKPKWDAVVGKPFNDRVTPQVQ